MTTTIHTPSDYHDKLEAQVGTYTVIGYLAHDDDCMNPLEDCDGMGYIVGRGKYQTRGHDESELFEALGLTSYGDPDTDHDAVQSRVQRQYEAWVDSLTAESVVNVAHESYDPLRFLQELRNLDVDPNYDVSDYLVEAGRATFEYPDYLAWRDIYDGTWGAVAMDFPDLKLDWEKAWEEALEAGEIGDPDAVMLDVYDHSGLVWSVLGSGTQCAWDTSHGAGVWLPDAEARHEIARRTAAGKNRRAAALELAQQALDTYNAWLAGDCWGICVEVYDAAGELVEDDACWGFVGGDWAMQDLQASFDFQVETLKKRVEDETRLERAANRFRDAMSNAL